MALRKNYYFFIWGQSNALGAGSDISALAALTYANYISYGGGEQLQVRYAQQSNCTNNYPTACPVETSWKRLECVSPTNNKTFGPEISAGFDLNQVIGIGTTEDANIWIIKCATGNTDLENDWHPTTPSGSMQLYARAKAYCNARIAEIEANAGTPGDAIFLGLLWVHGEADAQVGFHATYEANMQLLVDQVRTDFGDGTEPIGIVRLGTDQVLANKADIVTAQNNIATANTGVAIINTDDLLVNVSSPPHWTNEGYITIGQRWASQLITHWGF